MINAFVSCSFQESDRQVIEHILAILESEGIHPLVPFPSQDVALKPPAEKIRTDILQSDCLIAVVTKISGWIQNEIGMAYMAHKPVYIISEEKVENVGGMAPGITDILSFDRKKIDAIRPVVTKLFQKISQFLFYGHKMEWYGEAVHEIIARMGHAQKIDIIGRSTETFFDALNQAIRDRIHHMEDPKKTELDFRIYFVPADDSDTNIRPSAKRVLPKWKKRYSKTKFYVLPRREVQLRAIILDRDTGKDECFAGVYTVDDQGIYLGVTQQMERCDRMSLSYHLLREVINKAIPYNQNSS